MKKSLSLLIALCLVFGVFAGATAYADEAEKPVVYFTDDISPEGLVAVYEALNWKPTGPVAVKLSTGEPPYSNYLRPELIADLVGLCRLPCGNRRALSGCGGPRLYRDRGFSDHG